MLILNCLKQIMALKKNSKIFFFFQNGRKKKSGKKNKIQKF